MPSVNQKQSGPLQFDSFSDKNLYLDKESFFLFLIVKLAKIVEERFGKQESTDLFSIIGANLAHEINSYYREKFSKDKLSAECIATSLIEFSAKLNEKFYLVSLDQDKLVLGNKNCPYGVELKDREVFCQLDKSMAENMVKENFGYGKAELSQTIAQGDEECLITIYLKPENDPSYKKQELKFGLPTDQWLFNEFLHDIKFLLNSASESKERLDVDKLKPVAAVSPEASSLAEISKVTSLLERIVERKNINAPSYQNINLAPIIRRCLSDLKNQLPNLNVKIRCYIPEILLLNADPDKLKSALDFIMQGFIQSHHRDYTFYIEVKMKANGKLSFSITNNSHIFDEEPSFDNEKDVYQHKKQSEYIYLSKKLAEAYAGKFLYSFGEKGDFVRILFSLHDIKRVN